MRCALVAGLVAAAVAVTAPPASAAHTCRQGDPPLRVSDRTSCWFAGNVVTRWANDGAQENREWHGDVRSPVTKRSYRMVCTLTAEGEYEWRVSCHGPRASGVWVRFRWDA
jgi:hypothetical protein